MKCFNLLVFNCLCLSLTAQFSWNTLPDNIYPDSMHAPFILGVASNEPSQSAITIWTFTEPDTTLAGSMINYELAIDDSFNNVIHTGTLFTDSTSGFTASIRVVGLSNNTAYFYRFTDTFGNTSVTGRTRTLPASATQIKLALTSCSSIYSGYFNAYQNIAKRKDINAVVHLGDFQYDFMDSDELNRVPDPPAPDIECDLQDRYKRLYYYMLDEDMRKVRQMHPFIQIWDNHDVEYSLSLVDREPCIKAFRDFTGLPVFDTTDVGRIYRKINAGPLLDIFMIDLGAQRDRDSIAPGEESYLGIAQYNWLINELNNSTAKWKLVGNQKMVTGFSIGDLGPLIGASGNVLTTSSWDGYQLERKRLLAFIDSSNIDNVMFLSGDMHFALYADLPIDPFDTTSIYAYDEATQSGSVAVNFMGTSVSRGNFDERGFDTIFHQTIKDATKDLNPYHRFVDFISHGYGLIDISWDSISAQTWFNPILIDSDNQWLGGELILRDGDNHWSVPAHRTTGIAPHFLGTSFTIFPNPAGDEINVNFDLNSNEVMKLQIHTPSGQLLLEQQHQSLTGSNTITIALNDIAGGLYFLSLIDNSGNRTIERFIIE